MSSAAKTVKAPAQTFGISGRYASALWQHANKVGALEKVGAVFLYGKARGLVLLWLGLVSARENSPQVEKAQRSILEWKRRR